MNGEATRSSPFSRLPNVPSEPRRSSSGRRDSWCDEHWSFSTRVLLPAYASQPSGPSSLPTTFSGQRGSGSLKKKGVAYIVGRANYRENARGRIIGDQDGFLKLLFRQDNLKLIGVHIMGDLATEVVHIGLMAMMCNASANLFVDACFNLPTLGMLYKTATMNALQNVLPSENHA